MFEDFIPVLNVWQRFKIWLIGHVYIGDMKKPDWSGYIPMYMMRCPVHGYVMCRVSNYRYLRCPYCLEDAVTHDEFHPNA